MTWKTIYQNNLFRVWIIKKMCLHSRKDVHQKRKMKNSILNWTAATKQLSCVCPLMMKSYTLPYTSRILLAPVLDSFYLWEPTSGLYFPYCCPAHWAVFYQGLECHSAPLSMRSFNQTQFIGVYYFRLGHYLSIFLAYHCCIDSEVTWIRRSSAECWSFSDDTCIPFPVYASSDYFGKICLF